MRIPRRFLVLPSSFHNVKTVFRMLAASTTLAAVALIAVSLKTSHVRAGEQDDDEHERSKAEIGISIAPVPLHLEGKNKELVGLGSYIVNAQADCNGCHTLNPQAEYIATGNPYLLRPPNGPYMGKKLVNPQAYLSGGSEFGPFPGLQHLYSRNLTPDKTGRPAGGETWHEFLTVMRTGKDFDHLHPSCTGAPDGSCVPAPFNGNLLQVMPWPAFRDMSDKELRAIYEYLSAIPCVDTVIDGAPYLRNDCQ